jgi:hypothetical protein
VFPFFLRIPSMVIYEFNLGFETGPKGHRILVVTPKILK